MKKVDDDEENTDMSYFSMEAKCFLCGKDLGLMTARGRWELADGKWICVNCAKKHGMNSLKIKYLTSEDVVNIIEGKRTFDNQEQIENSDSHIIYSIVGTSGKRLRVYEDKCIISTKAKVGSFLVGNGSDGEKTIYYSDVIGIQFKRPGIQIGYLQLETASGLMNNKQNNFFNENTFTFANSEVSLEKMEEIRDYIAKKIEVYKTRGNDQMVKFSSADEILKFKKLYDDGVITEEEFEKKKKQLLDL